MPGDEWEWAGARPQYVGSTGVVGGRGGNPSTKKWWSHMPAVEIKNNIGNNIWGQYYKFCIVRNPYDKLISLFFFKDTNRMNLSNELIVEQFREWIKVSPIPVDNAGYLIDGEICVDYIIKYESLHEGIKHVCNHLSIPYDPVRLPKFKSGYRKEIPIADFYDNETKDAVEQAYEFEFSQFQYKLE